MMEIRGVIGKIRNRKQEEKKANSAQRSDFVARSSLAIPWLIFVFANLVLAFGEYRVWHYVNQTIGRPELAWGTLAATGVGAEVWFIAWKYPLATQAQKIMSVVMMFLNFAVATYIGFGDFFVDGTGKSYGVTQEVMISMIAVVLLLDIVIGIVYFLVDKQVERDRIRAEAQADLMDQHHTVNLANKMLENAQSILERQSKLYGEFGEDNVEDVLRLLAGDTGTDKKIADNFKQKPQNFQRQQAYAADTKQVRSEVDPDGDPNE